MDLCHLSTSTDGHVVAGGLAFHQEGRASLAVLVKATFRLVDARPAEVMAPEMLVLKDRHIGEDGARSLVAASDVLPFRPRCDVTLVGHACAPSGTMVRVRPVRLVVARRTSDGAQAPNVARSGSGFVSNAENPLALGQSVSLAAHPQEGNQPPADGGTWRSLLDKTLLLFGESGNAGPEPFERSRVAYEVARGGPSVPENPVGRPIPLLVDPLDETRVSAFGPIPPFWPSRRAKRGSVDASVLKESAPNLPANFPWDFFQAAPPDQQVDGLSGGELIQLDGFFADRFRLTTRLPGCRALAVLYRLAPSGQVAELPLSLVLDTLAIDTDRGIANVVWRARASLSSLEDVAVLHLAARLAIAGSAASWPSHKEVAFHIQNRERSAPPSRAPSRLSGQTVSLPDEAPMSRQGATPFVQALPPLSAAPFSSPAGLPSVVVSEAPPHPQPYLPAAQFPPVGPPPRPKTIGEMMAVNAATVSTSPAPVAPVLLVKSTGRSPLDDEEGDAPSAEDVARVLREAGASDDLVKRIVARL